MNKNIIPLIIIAIAVICFGLAVLALVNVPESYRTFPAKNMDGPHDWHEPAEKGTMEVIKPDMNPDQKPDSGADENDDVEDNREIPE
jgi:hypothetical protein